MFDLKFQITGGSIRLKKTAFLMEMLGKDKMLRDLLDWRSTGDFSKKHPQVSEPDPQGYVTITFTDTRIELGEDYEQYLKQLKDRYGREVSGQVACRGSYGTLFYFTLDLDGDALQIRHGS